MAETSLRGRIIKGIAGFYYVAVEGGGLLECHAKGIFRKEQVKPLVGDWVRVARLEQEEGKGSIKEIETRRNRLIRPDVANVDQALVVFAHASPQPNLNLLDKFLIMMEKKEIPCVLCFNKEDLVSEEEKEKLCGIYAGSGVRVLSLQADAHPDKELLRGILDHKLTVLAGPSGVGKSTLINGLCPEAKMETGSISRKLERGKHTTRHSQIFELWEDTYMIDTPGFTAFELDPDIEKETLKAYYPEFYEQEGNCRYQGCTHTHEPGCAVKTAVEEGKVARVRYEGYVAMFEELKSRRKSYIRNT